MFLMLFQKDVFFFCHQNKHILEDFRNQNKHIRENYFEKM